MTSICESTIPGHDDQIRLLAIYPCLEYLSVWQYSPFSVIYLNTALPIDTVVRGAHWLLYAIA